MKFIECSMFDETFTHTDDITGISRIFNVTKMHAFAARGVGKVELIELPIDVAYVKFIWEFRGIEQWRLDRLIEPYLSLPVLMVELPTGEHLSVDGHHRWVRKHQLEHSCICAYRFPLGRWEQFLIEGLSQEQLHAIAAGDLTGRKPLANVDGGRCMSNKDRR